MNMQSFDAGYAATPLPGRAQATVAPIIGIAAGVPLGISLGQWLWTLFAR
jgi:hypothetical protein